MGCSVLPKGHGQAALDNSHFRDHDRARSKRRYAPTDAVCLLTGKRNELNWFALSDPKDANSFTVHADGYEWLSSAPNHAAVVHLVAKKVLDAAIERAGVCLSLCFTPLLADASSKLVRRKTHARIAAARSGHLRGVRADD